MSSLGQSVRLAYVTEPAGSPVLQPCPGDAQLQPSINNRAQDRSNVFLAGVLVVGRETLPVRVRNLSTRGALLDGESLPATGARVRLLRGELSADGEMAWRTGGQAGLRFLHEIDVERWVRRVGHLGQQRVDDAVAALRRDELAPIGGRGAQVPSLVQISAELEAICERLADSPGMTTQVAEELLRLDALARQLHQLSGRDGL